MMGTLDPDTIEKLFENAVRLGLDRDALLLGIPSAFVATLKAHATPANQILSDLHALNDSGELLDGSKPLAVWLKNASLLSRFRPESLLFEDTLQGLRPTFGPFQAGNERSSLVVLGPRVVAEGRRVAASQGAWTIRIDRFLFGNDAALSTVGDRLANLPPDEHFVVLNDPDDAREVTGTVRWTRHRDYYEVHVPVAPPRLPQTVRDRESIDVETMRDVKGVKAGATALRCWLGQGVGHFGVDDRVGCWFPLWWPIASLVEHRDTLVRMEIVRLAGIPRLMSEYTGEVSAPLDFVDRVVSVSVRRDDREEDHFTANVEIFMIGAKDLWSGTIMLATELPPPFEDIMAGLLRQMGRM